MVLPETRQYLCVIQAVIIGLVIGLYLLTIHAAAQNPQSTDFLKFYTSSQFFWSGNNIYTLIPITSLEGAKIAQYHHPNLNSPFLILIMSLFGLIDFQTAFWLWSVLSLCCGLLAITLFYKTIINNDTIDSVALMTTWMILLIYYPSWINCRLGQFSLILLLLIVLVWRSSRRGQDMRAGLLLGLAAGLKLFFGIFFVLFLCYRKWRLVLWAIGIFVVCNILSLAIVKISTFENFFHLLQHMPWYAGSWNASFLGFLTRIFGGSMNVPLINLPWLARTLALLLSLALLGWLVWWTRSNSGGSGVDRFDLVFSLALVEMLLISPYGWLYYFPLLIFPLVVAWRFVTNHDLSLVWKISIIAVWALTTIPTQLIWAEDVRMNQPVIWFTSAGLYFYALVALTGICMGLLSQSHKALLPGEASAPSHVLK